MDNAPPASGSSPAEADPKSGGENPASKPQLPSQFPDKLMALLQKKVAPDALWWLPNMGNMKGIFAINRKVFTEKVLDMAFNGNKWPSITRNFNRWYVKVWLARPDRWL